MKRILLWRLCCAAVILLSILTFTPLVVPAGQVEPRLGPLPYSLWMGFIWAGLLVGLTILGVFVHPSREEGGDRT